MHRYESDVTVFEKNNYSSNTEKKHLDNKKQIMILTVGILIFTARLFDIGTVVYVAIDGTYAGYIIVSDKIKNDSKEAIRLLKKNYILVKE